MMRRAGLWITIPFSRRVYWQANGTSILANPNEFEIQCWWGEIRSPLNGMTKER
jgi:hypothetical protein